MRAINEIEEREAELSRLREIVGRLDTTPEGPARRRLIQRFSWHEYTFTAYAPHPLDGSIPGTWTQVVAARVGGLLSDEEFREICAAVRLPRL